MKCPACGSDEIGVIATRAPDKGPALARAIGERHPTMLTRKRRCITCQHVWWTGEINLTSMEAACRTTS